MTSLDSRPLLSITIPTFNRADYLALSLEQLKLESVGCEGQLEVIVCDNASSDTTPQIVEAAIAQGQRIRYARNAQDIGSDANFAQCFNLANGHYVLLLGDDDVLVDGALRSLLGVLQSRAYGVVCLRPYGYVSDFRREYPGGKEWSGRSYRDANEFFAKIGALITLISACAIHKTLLGELDARKFQGGYFLHVHLVIRAALAATDNLFVTQYQIACKRNNSGGYDFSQVFVTNLSEVFDSCREIGLSKSAVRAIETRLLLVFYPYYVLRMRMARTGDMQKTKVIFQSRFHDRMLYWLWVSPIIELPRPLALVWGGFTTMFGRILGGDFRRGIAFTWNRVFGAR